MIKKPDYVYIYQGDIGELADALGEALQVSPRPVGGDLYVFGASLDFLDAEIALRRPNRNFTLVSVKDYSSMGTGTTLMGALFDLF